MPRRKAASGSSTAWDSASSGNGTGTSRRRPGSARGAPPAKKKTRDETGSSSSNGGDGSSGDERDGLALPPGTAAPTAAGGGKKVARPRGTGDQQPPQNQQPPQAAMVVSEPEHSKEHIKLEGSKFKGQLLIFGATNWDLIGRKEVPKQQAAYRNLGQNLWGPHRYGCLSGVQVRTVISGPCAAHSLLITTEGKLWSWGRNDKGQLGHGDTKRVDAPKPIEVLGSEIVVSAACGRNHTLALTESGSVFAFGENKMGQLGLGNQTDAVPSPTQIMYNGQPITKMACGAEFSMVMDCKGNLYSFGCPEYGQLGHNSDGKFIARAQRIEYDCELVPRRVAIFIEKTKDGQILPVPNVVVRDVACGANHTLVLDSQKRVFSWGFGGYGRLGHAEQRDEMVPRLVKLFDFPGRGAAQTYAGYTCSFAVSETGGLFFWGATNTSRESTMYPKTVQDLCGWKIRSLACGKSSIIVAADESTISWGPSPTFGELGYGDHKPKSSTAAQEVKTLDGIYTEQVAMGYSHSLAIARAESDAEKERLKKLPEYNPRTL
ncbi:protein RCC2 isoform X2 [Varanus komodoensis]|uniref:Regulator of chromosome condensation 2 n=2 Tax=Varanus komodoensis TaxID=61221 RepID=A0A8D2JFT9_VARKO|nr:protein RCC2 isoform X2 [Varanus komodoensis]XP_044277204.1 protein RCC2 isoform X2 [Varanus komodoensis]